MTEFSGTLDSVEACREIAQDVLGKDWTSQVGKAAKADGGTLWALGYCHIDTAW